MTQQIKTKEEILRRVFPKDCIWEEMGHVDNAPFGMVYAAMDKYAQQIAILFAEWAAKNDWYFNKISKWSNRNESSDGLLPTLASMKTTSELYQIFLQPTNQTSNT